MAIYLLSAPGVGSYSWMIDAFIGLVSPGTSPARGYGMVASELALSTWFLGNNQLSLRCSHAFAHTHDCSLPLRLYEPTLAIWFSLASRVDRVGVAILNVSVITRMVLGPVWSRS